MKAIKQFHITGMTISGFKSYAEPTEIEFGNPTLITGGNGRGKSSIADAIAFVVTGLPFFGERGIDRLHSEQNSDLYLSMRFTDETGAAHELTRSRQKGRMSITYDGYEIRQHDLTDLFGEKDVFLSIFNPLYFIEELGDDGKKLLERYLPEISQSAILEQLGEETRTILQGETILSPEAYLKKRREEIRDLEQSITYLTGQKDYAEKQRQDAFNLVGGLETCLAALQEEYAALEAKRFEGMDISGLQEKLVDLSERYEALSKEPAASGSTEDLDKQLKSLHYKRGERSAEQYVPKYAQQLAEYTTRIKELAKSYKREAALLQGFRAGTVCPTCHRAVTEAELPTVQAELKKAADAFFAEGTQQREQMNELVALEKQTEDTFRQFQADDLAALEQEIAALEQKRTALVEQALLQNEQRAAELEELRSQIRSLSADAECGVLTQQEYERLTACKEEISSCKAELTAARNAQSAEPEDFDAKIKAAEQQIKAKKKLLAEVALYISKRAEMTFSKLQMNKVQISLYDVVKTTGEVKDTFRFTYNGRRYDRLSLSEKIRAGMEVSELMKQLTGRNYPQFIDNMESVDDLANVRPTGQIIMAKCVRGAELSIRPMNKPKTELPKAA